MNLILLPEWEGNPTFQRAKQIFDSPMAGQEIAWLKELPKPYKLTKPMEVMVYEDFFVEGRKNHIYHNLPTIGNPEVITGNGTTLDDAFKDFTLSLCAKYNFLERKFSGFSGLMRNLGYPARLSNQERNLKLQRDYLNSIIIKD